MSNAIKIGSEILVNFTTTEDQSEPAIAALSGGRFVVAWTDWSPSAGDTPAPGGDMSVSAIRAQIFDANGTKLDEEFLVNTTTTQGQNMPAIATLTDGRFLISWADASHSGGDTSDGAVRGQLFTAGGAKDGVEFILPTSRNNTQADPALASLPDGRFVAVWTDYGNTGDPNPPGVRGQVFKANGEPDGEFQVNVATTTYQGEPTIAALTDGRFVVAWTDYSSGTGSSDIRARLFDSDGAALGGEWVVNTTTSSGQFTPSITALANGGFVVAWTDGSMSAGDGSDYGVIAQVFAADGDPVNGEFVVNTTTTSRQQQPCITAMPDGRFVAVWTDSSGTTATGFDVCAQVFDSNGTKLGPEFVVNTTVNAAQWKPTVTALENGKFVVAWEDQSEIGGDTDGSAIRAQIFSVNESPVITSDGGGSTATFSVAENTNAAVTTVTASDPDGPTLTYQIVAGDDSGSFQIDQTTGVLSFVYPPNFEIPGDYLGDNSYEVVVAASDGISSDLQTITVNVTDANDAPFITSQGGYPTANYAIAENTSAVGTITAADPDGDARTYSIAGGADAALFQIDESTGVLSFIDAPDYEAPADADHNNSYQIQVRAWDGELFSEQQAITVEVSNDTAESIAPVITSNGGGDNATLSHAENTTVVTTVTASDANGDALSYWIVGGADAALFQIDEETGVLSFVDAPDYEAPADADHNNSYQVQVRASDGNLLDEQTIWVDVADLAPPNKFGDEILVNTTTASFQESPAITGLANGRFVVTWYDGSNSPDDPSLSAIRAQVFNADGSKAGSEFRVNATTSDGQYLPAITALADGRFVVTWTSDTGDGSDTAILGQVFDADGSPLGSELVINATTDNYQELSSITALPDGSFAVAWSDYSRTGGDTSEHAIRARIFDAAGNESVAEFLVNTTADWSQYGPTITALANGNFVVAWEDWSQTGGDPSSGAVRARVFHADGTPLGPEVLVNTTTYNFQEEPRITALADGRFVVAWSDYSQSQDDPSGYAVRARIFNADGSESVAEFLVNTQTFSYQSNPQLTALADGRFVASWFDSSNGGSGGGTAVSAQIFKADGTRSGDEFEVVAPSFGPEGHAITALADARFVIAWSGEYETGGDTDYSSIHAQIFDPREGPVNLVGTPLDDDLVGTRFNDTITGLGGNDRLDGGDGDDTAFFSQSRDKYTIIEAGDMTVVQGPDGTDILHNFEHLQFADAIPTPPVPTPPQAPEPSAPVTGLFDTRYYLTHNPDVAAAKVGALDHYNVFGWHEGRDPNAFFDTAGYLAANKDAGAAGVNPLQHYHQSGWHEGRDPSAEFDTTLYLLHNPDVAAAGVDPLEHYLQHGMAEGRAIYQAIGQDLVGGFDAEWYLFHNPDVAAAGVDALEHFNTYGWHEGRKANAFFDTAGYLAHYTDVAAAGVNPLEHYMQHGWKEGRDPSASFDTAGYLAANPDVAAAGVNPLEHYLQFGIYEGRQLGNDGVWG